MKKWFGVVLTIVLTLTLNTQAQALVIPYDTGVANVDEANMAYFNDGRSAYAQFQVEENSILTHLESLIASNLTQDSDPVYLKVALYQGSEFNPPEHPSAGLEYPNLLEEVVSYQFTLPVGDITNYYGLQAVHVPLHANIPYWVGWEAVDAGVVGEVALIDAAHPLNKSIYRYEGTGFVDDAHRPHFNVRLDGRTNVIPEASTVSMMVIGCIGLIGLHRRKIA